MKHPWYRRVLALVLAFVFILQATPSSSIVAFATEMEDTSSAQEMPTDEFIDLESETASEITDYSIEPTNPVALLGEVESLRSEDEKHFRMSDGSFMAVSYGMPVHYLDDEGQWQEIDNSMVGLTAGEQTVAYQNSDSLANTMFAASLATGELFTTSFIGYSVSMSLLDSSQADQITATAEAGLVTGLEPDNFETVTYNRNAVGVPDNLVESEATDTELETASVEATETEESSGFLSDTHPGWDTKDLIPENLYSSITYADVYPGVDLVYSAYSYNIKEQIVVKSPQDSYRYDFLLDLDGLTAVLQEDGSINLVNSEDLVVYAIPAPFMADAAGTGSQAVTYTLTETEQGTVLTVEADKEWINDENRVFPVTIDPTLTVKVTWNGTTASSQMYMTFVIEGVPNTATGYYTDQSIGYSPYNPGDGARKNMQAYVHFNKLPTVPAGSFVVAANLELFLLDYSYIGSQTELRIGAHPVSTTPSGGTSYFNWMKAMTWTNKANYTSNRMIDYAVTSSSLDDTYITFDLTSQAKTWYKDEIANRTVALVAAPDDPMTDSNCAAITYSAFSTNTPPIFTVSYRNNVGLEPYYTYASLDVGLAGTAYIADATGQLRMTHEVASYASAINPFSLNLVYNSDYFTRYNFTDTNINNTSEFHPTVDMGLTMKVGSGWTLDAIQKAKIETISGTTYIKYTDGDGTVHWFAQDWVKDSTGTWFYDEDGLGLRMRIISTTNNNHEMKDDYGNTWTFTYSFLTKYTDSNNNVINFNYDFTNWRLTSITQVNNGCSAVTLASFGYSGNNLITITDMSGVANSLTYSGGNLISVTRGSNQTAEFSYDGHKMIMVKDFLRGRAIHFTYDDTINRINLIYEKGSSGTTGFQIAMEYPNDSETIYWDYGLDGTKETENNPDDLRTHYLFDNAGRTVNVYTTNAKDTIVYGASNAAYTGIGTTDKSNNRVLRTASIGVPAMQLLQNYGFETSSGWTISGTNNAISSEAERTGNYGFKGYWSSGTTSAKMTTSSLPAGTYTLSAYVKTSAINNYSNNGIYLQVTANGSTYKSESLMYKTDTEIDNGWVRLSVTYTTSATCTHTIGIYNNGAAGYYYADDFQLELGAAPSNLNLVQAGNMEVEGYWANATYATSTQGANTTKKLKLTATPTDNSTSYQDIPINRAGDTFVASAWAWGYAVPDNRQTASEPGRDYEKQFGLKVVVYYSDGTSEYHYSPFNACLRGVWQFNSLTVVPKKPTTTITKVRVVLPYDKNANYVVFDNVALVRTQTQAMEYDANGNVTKSDTSGTAEQGASYSGTKLSTYNTGTAGSYSYTYGNSSRPYRVTSIKNTAVSLTQSLGYDDVGNVTSTTLSGTETRTIKSSASYISNNNLLGTSTDTAGNTTTYAYSSANHQRVALPSTITNAKGVVTTQTTDIFGRIRQVSLADGTALVYTYGSARLHSLKRTDSAGNAQTYGFTYDGFNNLTKLTVGSTALATYSYGAHNGPLVKQTYANGDYVSYTYDNLGRTTKAAWENGHSATYVYTGDGQLHKVTDVGDTTSVFTYTYDDVGRLTSSQKKTGSTTELQTSMGYDSSGRLSTQKWKMGTDVYSQTYNYSTADGSLTSMTPGTGQTLTFNYDVLRRLSTITGGVGTRTYTYLDKSDRTTTQVKSLAYSSPAKTFSYTYDVLGNIATYGATGYTTVTYTYDNQSQLTKAVGSKTYTYTYDSVGNIKTASNGTTTNTYTYGNTNWRDQLTKFNGVSLVYDSSGNPTTYYNGTSWTMTWEQGRQLVKAVSGSTTINFSYDYTGLRTAKKVGSTTYNYIYASGKLLRQTGNGYTLDFVYDNAGRPYAMKYNGTWYYYVLNLQGDVIYLTNVNGTIYATYEYDPYGKIISATGTNDIHNINPLRYRGYYYDSESGMYYLQSRYYDPEICRFINADSYASTGQGVIGHNMYAYCRSNPTARTDALGTADVDCYDAETDVDIIDDDDLGNPPISSTSSGTSSSSGGGSSSSIQLVAGGSCQTVAGDPNNEPHEVHHIVEQCQQTKTGFSETDIQGSSNKVSLPRSVHRKISGYYSSKQPFSEDKRVRDWLAGQSYDFQYNFGLNAIEQAWGEIFGQ